MKIPRRAGDKKQQQQHVVGSNHHTSSTNHQLQQSDKEKIRDVEAVENHHRDLNGVIDVSSHSPADKNRKNTWVQLAGHPGSFVPAGPNTILKKQTSREMSEAKTYKALVGDTIQGVTPVFYREVERNNEVFVEMEDLLQHFSNPNIMDIKMGTRTFLESEVKNPALRSDLYEKMVKIDPTEPTTEEHNKAAITKLRYMQFREKGSTSASLGFRIDAIRFAGEPANTDLKQVSTRQNVSDTMLEFIGARPTICQNLLDRLREIRGRFETSKFFKHHEIIGSSLLVMYDSVGDRVGVWMIDFAKTQSVRRSVTHRTTWQPGNHEDGYLTGLDNLIQIISEIVDQQRCEPDVVGQIHRHVDPTEVALLPADMTR